jgi:hypothetical protein
MSKSPRDDLDLQPTRKFLYDADRPQRIPGPFCLFGDGSVQFIKNSINGSTWIQVGSINGGEVISSDHY